MELVDLDLKGKLKAREEEVNALRYETDHVKNMNAKYVDDSQELQLEIEALNRHMQTINQ